MIRPVSFDEDRARQAWRQFARAHGVAGRDPAAGPRRWGPWLFLALGIVAAATIYQTRSQAPSPVAAVAPAGSSPSGKAGESTPPTVAKATGPTLPKLATPVPPPGRAPEAVDAAGSGATRPPIATPSPYAPKVRDAPDGTDPDYAEALRKIPRARSDRAPIGGVGIHGIHVDRITIGPRREDGACGEGRRNLARTDEYVQVCFRVVHQRQVQRLVVRWLHGGELERRTFLSVPDHRAYRTRAWMPLGGRREDPQGDWVAVVETEDGIELAREKFSVN